MFLMKHTIYLFFTTVLGVLVSYIAHALIEIWYLRWAQDTEREIVWTKHLGFASCALPIWVQYGLLALGLLGGYWSGRTGWRIVYIEHRHS